MRSSQCFPGEPVAYHERRSDPASTARAALSSLYLLPSASSFFIPSVTGSAYRVNGRSSAMIFAIYTVITVRDPMAKRVKALNARREELKAGIVGSWGQDSACTSGTLTSNHLRS